MQKMRQPPLGVGTAHDIILRAEENMNDLPLCTDASARLGVVESLEIGGSARPHWQHQRHSELAGWPGGSSAVWRAARIQ